MADEKAPEEVSLDVVLVQRMTEERHAAGARLAPGSLVCDTLRLGLPRIQASQVAEAVVALVAADSHRPQDTPDKELTAAEQLVLGTLLAEKAELVATQHPLNACSGMSTSQAALVEAYSQPFLCEAEWYRNSKSFLLWERLDAFRIRLRQP